MSNDELKRAVRELIEASKPFVSEFVVDETNGTISLMNRLEKAIESVEECLSKEEN